MNGYNFTDRVRKVLQLAREEAHRLGHEYVGTEHILLAIIREGEGVAQAVLTNLNVDLEEISRRIEETVKKGKAAVPARPDLPYTSRAKKVLEFSMSEARELNDKYVGTEHLLLGVLREEKGIGALVLTEAGVTLDAARSEVVRMLRTEMSEASATTPPATPPVPYTPDVRRVPRGQLDHARREQRRGLARGFEGHGVVHTMQEQGAGSGTIRKGLLDLFAEIVRAQTLPHRLTGALGDPKRRHLPRAARVAKVAGDG